MNPHAQAWLLFLFGTPRRALTTLGVILAIVLVINPDLGRMFFARLMIALRPLFEGVLWIIVIAIGFGCISAVWKSKSKK